MNDGFALRLRFALRTFSDLRTANIANPLAVAQ